MAQLPPKGPSMTQNWPSSFPFQAMPLSTSSAAAAQQNPWVDEFLDFSSARRNFHRRSVSDPIAFVEAPFMDECRGGALMTCSNNGNGNANNGFDRLDDEQLTSMFPDDSSAAAAAATAPSSNPSTTSSDQISENEEKPQTRRHEIQPKNEPGEVVDSSYKTQPAQPATRPSPANDSGDTSNAIVDPKRIKRILANRQSAQRSRVRKLQYISELERSVTTLQTEVSALSPRVAFLDHQRLILNVDNSALKQRIAALAQDKIFKDAHQEALKKEIERLRQIYHEQNLKNTTAGNNGDGEEAAAPAAQQDGLQQQQ
ncbi:PREDICTED: basic leucine zipper 34-like [Ipomoea nil]|uniref:basic leucine zipper 34-like n=1 Tax=Ipomoea nil TaxID=35883 RepID=UPI000901F8F0|nr:PREDICTED: basic leucine zipper 34-like [Ipomoea nil]